MERSINRLHFKLEKEPSIMQAIPPSHDMLLDLSSSINNLKACGEFKNISFPQPEMIKFDYNDKTYKAFVYKEDVNIFQLKIQHKLTDDEKHRCKTSPSGLTVSMIFDKDYSACYQLQLKLLTTLVPNAVGIADYSSLTLLSGRWAALQASSSTLIPNDVDSDSLIVRADVEVYSHGYWIHTHGMKRICGCEFECDAIPKEEESYPEFMLFEKVCKEFLDNNADLSVDCLLKFGDDMHLLVQPSTEHFKDKEEKFQRIRNHEIENFMYVHMLENSNDGTLKHSISFCRSLKSDISWLFDPSPELYKPLAQERIHYIKKHFDEDNILVNVHKDEFHWIKLIDLEDETFTGCYIGDDASTPTVHSFSVRDINNWLIYEGDDTISPDDVYLLQDKKSEFNPLLLNDRKRFIAKLHEFLEVGDSEKIIDYIDHVNNLDYELTLIYVKSLINMSYYPLARYYLLREINVGKDDPEWLYLMAAANRLMYNDRIAEYIISRALEINPNHINTLIENASLKINQKHYDDALSILNQVINTKEFSSVLTKGEEKSVFNMMNYCDYYIEENQRLQRLNTVKMFYSGGAYKKVISTLNKESELYPDQRILYSNSLTKLDQPKKALAQLNQVEDDFRNDEWYRAIISAYDALADESSEKKLKSDFEKFTLDSQKYSDALFKEMFDTIISDDKFIGFYTDPKDQLIFILHYDDENIFKALKDFNKDRTNCKLFAYNLGVLLESYLNKNIDCDFVFKHELNRYYDAIIFKAPKTDENIKALNQAGDFIQEIIFDSKLIEIFDEVKDSLELPQYDLSRKYDLSDSDDEFLLSDVLLDLHNSNAYEEQLQVFSVQENLSDDLYFRYICALNNVENFHKALTILDKFKDSYDEENYFNYLNAYAHFGSGAYDRAVAYATKSRELIQASSEDGDPENLLLLVYLHISEDDMISAKSALALLDIDRLKDSSFTQDALNNLLKISTSLKDDFDQQTLIKKCEKLVSEYKTDEAKELIKSIEITDRSSFNRLYHLLVDLEEYELALSYLNKVSESSRNDYWLYSVALCEIFSGNYSKGFELIESIEPLLKTLKKDLDLDRKGNVLYAYYSFLKGDIKSCRMILLELFHTEWLPVIHLNNLLKESYSEHITSADVEEYLELKKMFI